MEAEPVEECKNIENTDKKKQFFWGFFCVAYWCSTTDPIKYKYMAPIPKMYVILLPNNGLQSMLI